MGAPTSPVLSNMVSLQLDKALTEWSKSKEIVYTRFVDDLTFSSKTTAIDHEVLEEVKIICASQQFQLNPAKTKFYSPSDTKRVTGLVLNKTIDIEADFYQQLDRDLKRLKHVAEVNLIVNKHKHNEVFSAFKKEVDGQINFIGMIEGYNSPEFFKYRNKLKQAISPKEECLSIRWTNLNYL